MKKFLLGLSALALIGGVTYAIMKGEKSDEDDEEVNEISSDEIKGLMDEFSIEDDED